MTHGLGWSPLVLPLLSGETCAGYVTLWQGGRKGGEGESGRWGGGAEGESGEISVPVGELGEGEGEGCGVVGR